MTSIEWDYTQGRFQNIIKTHNACINEKCLNKQTPLSSLHRSHQQGGFFPRKQQTIWKQHLNSYHLIRETIHIINTQLYPTWIMHLDIQQLQALTNIILPSTTQDILAIQQWINELVNIGHTTKIEACKFTFKQTAMNCKKPITKYIIILNNKPKTIHTKNSRSTTNIPLDCLKDTNKNILTHCQDIAQKM